MSRIALHHLIERLEHRVGDVGHRDLLVIGILSRQNRRVRDEWKVNAWIGHEIRLKLDQVDVEGAVESK